MTAFIFREAILRAQTWGAFRADQFHREKLRLGLKLFSSVVLIAALPLLAVAFFWEIAETATGEPICQYLFSRFGMSVCPASDENGESVLRLR